MKYERPRACIHGGVANTKSVIYRTRIQGFSRKTASASGKHLFFGIISARELLETFLDWFWMISMCSDSSECFYDGESRLKPHISNEIACVKSPMWNSLPDMNTYITVTQSVFLSTMASKCLWICHDNRYNQFLFKNVNVYYFWSQTIFLRRMATLTTFKRFD